MRVKLACVHISFSTFFFIALREICVFSRVEGLILLSLCTADLLLVVSPVVPPRCYGQVLAVCERRGFRLRGLQRLQLQSNGAAVLGLTNQQVELDHPVRVRTV